MALTYATVGLDDKHDEILEELVKKKGASKTAVLRQALRVLNLVEQRRAAGFELVWRKDGVLGSLDAELAKLPEPATVAQKPDPEPPRTKRHIVIAPTYNAALEWGTLNGVDRQFIFWPVELQALVGLDFTQLEVVATGRWTHHAGCVTLLEYIRNHRTWEKGRVPKS